MRKGATLTMSTPKPIPSFTRQDTGTPADFPFVIVLIALYIIAGVMCCGLAIYGLSQGDGVTFVYGALGAVLCFGFAQLLGAVLWVVQKLQRIENRQSRTEEWIGVPAAKQEAPQRVAPVFTEQQLAQRMAERERAEEAYRRQCEEQRARRRQAVRAVFDRINNGMDRVSGGDTILKWVYVVCAVVLVAFGIVLAWA